MSRSSPNVLERLNIWVIARLALRASYCMLVQYWTNIEPIAALRLHPFRTLLWSPHAWLIRIQRWCSWTFPSGNDRVDDSPRLFDFVRFARTSPGRQSTHRAKDAGMHPATLCRSYRI